MGSKFTTAKARFACGLLAAISSGSVLAQASTPAQALLTDTFVFNLGSFVVNNDLSARLDGQSTQNPEYDFDKTFGRDADATRVRLDGLWRITPAHHLRFMYFSNARKASKVIDRDFIWGDYTFQVGGQVDTEYDNQTGALIYEWAFMRDPNYELAATLGVHYSKTTLKLSGSAIVTTPGGGPTPVQAVSRSDSVPAPLPVLGLRFGWAVAPNWHIDAEGQFFKINYEGIDGSWADLRLGATWMFSRNFGLGLGYNRFTARTDVSKNNFNGTLKTGYSGLQAYLTGSF
jgi:hypothetical protein